MKTIQPSLGLAIFSTLINFGVPGILFLAMVFFIGWIINISTVISAFAFLEINLSVGGLFLLFVLVVLGLVFGATLLNAVSVLGMRIEIYDSYVEYVHGVKRMQIPYANISQINYSKKGVSKLLGCATIFVNTTNMEEMHIAIPHVTQAELKIHEVEQKRQIIQKTQQTYQRMDDAGW